VQRSHSGQTVIVDAGDVRLSADELQQLSRGAASRFGRMKHKLQSSQRRLSQALGDASVGGMLRSSLLRAVGSRRKLVPSTGRRRPGARLLDSDAGDGAADDNWGRPKVSVAPVLGVHDDDAVHFAPTSSMVQELMKKVRTTGS
jgi:hypothetical protein